jgi:hydroxyacylglutathione hydrolase
LKIHQIPVGPMQNFVYLVEDEASSEAIAIDSGWETKPIVELASSRGMKVRYVAATHGHFDHVKTLSQLAAELGAETVAFEGSEVDARIKVKDREVLKLGEKGVTVIHTPGHTEDSVCYYTGSDLFTGDTLFIEAWGRTDLPGGSPEKLYSSLHRVIMRMPATTMIYPGHDYGNVRFRTLAGEAVKNKALRARTFDQFKNLVQA